MIERMHFKNGTTTFVQNNHIIACLFNDSRINNLSVVHFKVKLSKSHARLLLKPHWYLDQMI